MSNLGKIYCAHCIFTGKKYIGQTITKLEYRISQHFTFSKIYHHKFANALKKYGVSGFIWGIIEECEKDLLNEREIYWINEHNTFKKGYNSTLGGKESVNHCVKEYLIETPNGEKQLIINLTKYCRENDLRRSSMNKTLTGHCLTHKGYRIIPRTQKEIERYEETREIMENRILLSNKKKKQFILENYTKEYLIEKPNGEQELIKNLSQYCRDNNLRMSNMLRTLLGKSLTHKGYKLIPRTKEEIEKYNLERSIRENTSRKRLYGERNGMYNKKHKKETKEKIIERKRKLFAKTYHFISPEGELIIVYTTLREFCRKYNLDRKCITNVIKGKAKHHKGWTVPQLAQDT